MCLMQYIHKVTVHITEQLPRQRRIQNTCQTFKMERFAKNIMSAEAQPEIFQGRFVELEHFDKQFLKNTRKRAPQGSILEFFLLDTLKTIF